MHRLTPWICTAFEKEFQGMSLWISQTHLNLEKTYPRLSTEFPVLRKYTIALPWRAQICVRHMPYTHAEHTL